MFYNPSMAMDRDLGVAFVRAWATARGAPSTGWEMMAATGARGLRLIRESGSFATFTLTEANPAAVEVLRENARGLAGARVVLGDARKVPEGSPFDYVDLDPYGTPAPFVPAALSAVGPSGVLAVTATDMTVLAGAQSEACRRRYGSRPVRGRLGPEGGLRILVAFLARAAREQGRRIRPLLCYVRGHHVRAFVQVAESPPGNEPVGTIDPATWTGPYLGSDGPYGPLWLGPLFDRPLVDALETPPDAAEARQVTGFLARLHEEVMVDVPFYYEPNVLASSLSLSEPPSEIALLQGLRGEGYRAARTHARPEGIRTDAPRSEVEAVARRVGSPDQSQKARVRA